MSPRSSATSSPTRRAEEYSSSNIAASRARREAGSVLFLEFGAVALSAAGAVLLLRSWAVSSGVRALGRRWGFLGGRKPRAGLEVASPFSTRWSKNIRHAERRRGGGCGVFSGCGFAREGAAEGVGGDFSGGGFLCGFGERLQVAPVRGRRCAATTCALTRVPPKNFPRARKRMSPFP